MIRTLLFAAFLTLSPAAIAQDHSSHGSHGSSEHNHESHDHGDHSNHEGDGHNHTGHIALSRTTEIDAALAAGGTPVVVEVLGAVCDFCAKAMNKTFGKRNDVSAVYVDLDAKTLNLVLVSADAMDDFEIDRVVTKSGYKAKAIHRGADLVGGADAPNPS